MAIFGELEHHAFADLVKVLRPRTGTLFLHEVYHGRTLELSLERGDLLALYLDGFPVQQLPRLHEMLQLVTVQARGAFEFKDAALQETGATARALYRLPLEQLLHQLAPQDTPADELPHADTRFVARAGPHTPPPALADRWRQLGPYVQEGGSAAQIAQKVGLSTDQVRLALYLLRSADLVVPQRIMPPPQLQASLTPLQAPPHRATVSAPPIPALSGGSAVISSPTLSNPTLSNPALSSPPARTPPLSNQPVAQLPAPAPVLQRLLGALRRLTGTGRV